MAASGGCGRGVGREDSAVRAYVGDRLRAVVDSAGSALRAGGAYLSGVPGILYVVATPIGNLEDVTLRALRVLREVDLIAAEDTRVAAKLLGRYGIGTARTSYNDRNRGRKTAGLIARLEAGGTIALVSDAGTPGVSDPGRALVAAAVEAGAEVVPIPGAATPTALWSVAGTAGADVRFAGFLPRKRGERRAFLASLGQPTIVFESPHRVAAALADMAGTLPSARLVIGRELTKLHEQIWRGAAADAPAAFPEPRGEFAILIVPAPAGEWSDAEVAEAFSAAAAAGAPPSEAARRVARAAGRARSEVYALRPR